VDGDVGEGDENRQHGENRPTEASEPGLRPRITLEAFEDLEERGCGHEEE